MNRIPVPYEITARRPGNVATYYADLAKSKEVLGWQDLSDMCRDAWRRPMGYK